MTRLLEVRRQRIVQAIVKVDREIAVAQWRLAEIQVCIAALTSPQAKAA